MLAVFPFAVDLPLLPFLERCLHQALLDFEVHGEPVSGHRLVLVEAASLDEVEWAVAEARGEFRQAPSGHPWKMTH